jgi:hypothetical protein
MDILTPKAARRNTRLRVEIPLVLTSMDRRHPLSAQCVALVVSPQGCGVRSSQALPIETPVLLGDLPGGVTASGRVASCLPLGTDGKHFLIGVSLYNPGNVWGVANPPEDWNCPAEAKSSETSSRSNEAWPYNLHAGHGELHPRK